MRLVFLALILLSLIFIGACRSQAVSAQSANNKCPSLPLEEWVRDAVFAAYITPVEASGLAESKELCLPLRNTKNILGEPRKTCVAQQAFGFDVSNAWVSEFEKITFNENLYSTQKITPTIFTEPGHETSYCASLPKAEHAAIVIQTTNGSVFVAPTNKNTFDEIRRRIRLQIESGKLKKD